MNQASLQVLLVEDSPTDARLFQHVFFRAATENWTLVHAERLSDAIAQCQTQCFHVALLDLRLPDSEDLETIAQFHQAVPDIPIIILTVLDDEDLAIQAMAQGAQDYLVKDQVTPQLLRRSIRYTIERSQILHQLRHSERTTLKALDQERELNQLKSYFISMVSHEFRNPLNALQGMSSMLLHHSDRLTLQQKELCRQQIKSTIDQMCHLLDEVILFGKVDTGHLQLDKTPVILYEFFDELIMMLQYGDNYQHSIHLNCSPDLLPVEMDVNLLKHIFTNILTNALKYSPPGSNICMDVSVLKPWATFRVSDRGIGIPVADQPRLFEAFSRCRNVGQIQGTGLGLAIVKRCVDLYGGEIVIDSQENVGTTVTVMLPIAE